MSYSVGFSQSLEILFYIELKTKYEEAKYLTIQAISEKLAIPVPSVKRLVALLKNKGFIESKKGVNGGLALAMPAKSIRFYDVFEAIEGDVKLFKQYDDFDTNTFIHRQEAEYMLLKSKEIFDIAQSSMLKELKRRTLSELFMPEK